MATAKNIGLLPSTAINLSQEVTLSSTCKSYNDDNATLFVYVDDILVFSVDCPANKIINQDINLTGTNKSKIMLKAINKKRVVLYALKAETGLSTTERLDGYPIMTGDGNNHVVNDLTHNTTYYYYVTPFSDDNEGESSVIKSVTTKSESTDIEIVPQDQVLSYCYNGEINIINAPRGSRVILFDISGKKVFEKKTIQSAEVFKISGKDMYIMNIKHNDTNVIRKVYID